MHLTLLKVTVSALLQNNAEKLYLTLIIISCSHDLRYFAWWLPTLIKIMILTRWKTKVLDDNYYNKHCLPINGRETKDDSSLLW